MRQGMMTTPSGRQWGINFPIVSNTEVIQMAIVRISPEKFYKGGSQEKHTPLWPEFFLHPSPCDRARCVLNVRAMGLGAGHCDPAVWISLPVVFIGCSRRSQSVLKPAKQNGGQVPTMILYETLGLWLFRVVREGLGSSCETNNPRHILPNFLAENSLSNPSVSRTGRPPPETIQGWADSVRNTQAVCGFRCWASKHAPNVHTINTMVAIFLAKVRRAISGWRPLVSKVV